MIKGYEVNGQIHTQLSEVATALGVAKVREKDLLEGGKFADQVSIVDLTDDTVEASGAESSEEGTAVEAATEAAESGVEVSAEDAAADTDEQWESGNRLPVEDEDAGLNVSGDVDPEAVKAAMPEFESLDEFKEFFKDIDTPTAEYLARGLGATWNESPHAQINRMRVSMAMQRVLFPDQFQPKETEKKRKAKYGDHGTEELFELAKKHKVKFDKSGNEPIDRMRVIMALKKAGHLPE